MQCVICKTGKTDEGRVTLTNQVAGWLSNSWLSIISLLFGVCPRSGLGRFQVTLQQTGRLETTKPPLPARASQAQPGSARRGRPWMACVGRHEGTCWPTPGWAEKRRNQRGIGAAFFGTFLLLLTKRYSGPWQRTVVEAAKFDWPRNDATSVSPSGYWTKEMISCFLSSPLISSCGGTGFALVNATTLPAQSRIARVPFFARPKNGTQKRTPHTRLIPLPGTPSGVSLSGFLPRKLQPAIHGRLPPPVAPGSGACEGERKPSGRVAIEWLAQYHFVTFRCVPAQRAGALSSYRLCFMRY